MSDEGDGFGGGGGHTSVEDGLFVGTDEGSEEFGGYCAYGGHSTGTRTAKGHSVYTGVAFPWTRGMHGVGMVSRGCRTGDVDGFGGGWGSSIGIERITGSSERT